MGQISKIAMLYYNLLGVKMDSNKVKRNYTIEDLEELLDNIPYEVYIKDINGVYKYANKATVDRIGLDKEDVIGKNDYAVREKEMAQICVDGDQEVLKNGDKTFIEDKIINGNIETSYQLFKTLLYKNNKEKTMIGGVAKFVIEDKSLCNSIRINSNNIMNSPAELSNSVVYERILNDLQETILSDSVALYLYDKEKSIMKLNKNIGSNNFIFVSEYTITDEMKAEYYENFECEIKENLNDGSIKYIFLLKNNNELLGCLHIYFNRKPEDIKEEFIRYICIVLSFTEANKILTDNLNHQLKLKSEVQMKMQMMIDNIVDVYGLIEIEDGGVRWIEINRRCKEIIGWNLEELNSKNYLEFIHPNDREYVASKLDGNEEFNHSTFTMIGKDNRCKTFDAQVNHLTGNIYMITAKDVTTLNELKKDKEHFKHAMELEILKTEFFANVSHEFKTPLNIILSTVQLVMNYMEINNGYPSRENVERYLKSIKQNSYRLLKLANNMIDISKIDGDFYQINMGNHNIVEIVENIVQSLVVYMKDNKRNIIFDTMEEEIITACDPDQIERIILNLLSNAMKFTTLDGNIYVNMEINETCNKVIIKIGNDGQPISIEDSKKIFERFTQSENILTRSIEGSGIGLALTQSLVQIHQGIIYVNTEVEKGTEFCIELPIRKIMNSKPSDVRAKSIVSKVEKFDIEFSDIYE